MSVDITDWIFGLIHDWEKAMLSGFYGSEERSNLEWWFEDKHTFPPEIKKWLRHGSRLLDQNVEWLDEGAEFLKKSVSAQNDRLSLPPDALEWLQKWGQQHSRNFSNAPNHEL